MASNNTEQLARREDTVVEGVLQLLRDNDHLPLDENFLKESHNSVLVYKEGDITCYNIQYMEYDTIIWVEKDAWPVSIVFKERSTPGRDSEDPPSLTGR